MVFAPPLIIARNEVDEIVDRFGQSVEDVLGG
jgi:adenosylmethionine-8-amino-7-oxononanoate aminotransferase